MRAFILSAAGAFAIAIAASPAAAGVISMGGPMSYDCFQAASGKGVTRADLETCDRALSEEALRDYDRVATLVNRGILNARAGRKAAAIGDYDAAIALDPNLADAWLNKGFLYLREGNGKAALPLIEKGIELGSRRAALAHYGRAIAHEQAGNLKLAYADLRKAQELEPGWDAPRRELARYQVRDAR